MVAASAPFPAEQTQVLLHQDQESVLAISIRLKAHHKAHLKAHQSPIPLSSHRRLLTPTQVLA